MSEITKRSRELRKALTNAEKLLWDKICNKKLGSKFRRQYPIIYFDKASRHCFIEDFACLDKKLVIEIDGGIHDAQRDYDEMRSYIINRRGFKVIRFSNESVYSNIDSIVSEIRLNL